MKQFKYFTSQDWSNYIGPYLYRTLKKRYGTNKAIASAFERYTDFQTCKAVTGLKVSDHMTGKMQGIKCITSACTVNDHCKSLHTNGICKRCYAFKYLSMRPTVFNVYTNDDQIQKKDKLALHTCKCEKRCRFCLVCWENKIDDLMLVKEHLK